jgi:hypothetical protein
VNDDEAPGVLMGPVCCNDLKARPFQVLHDDDERDAHNRESDPGRAEKDAEQFHAGSEATVR